MMNNKVYFRTLITGILVVAVVVCITALSIITISAKNSYNRVAQIMAIDGSDRGKVVKVLQQNDVEQIQKGETLLLQFDISPKSFYQSNLITPLLLLTSFLVLGVVAIFILFIKGNRVRIKNLTNFLYDINTNNEAILPVEDEDDFSLLEDELSKTITELNVTREMAILNRESMAEYLEDISHQIKTPMTSIALMSELMMNGVNDKQYKTYLGNIDSNIWRIEKLVSSLLKLSKIDASSIRYDNKSIDVYSLLLSSLEVVEQMVVNKNQAVDLLQRDPISICGDAYWLSEAIINILKNCIEHSPNMGRIKIRYDENPIYKEILIEDSGDGILDKDIKHIFDRFYKGENSSKDGIGIGLALSKSIVEKQNGTIEVKNNKNLGTQFILRFYE